MRTCHGEHYLSDDAWSEASRNRVGDYYLHWHPDTLEELVNWFQQGGDRLRDEQFDVVVDIQHVSDDTVRIYWLGHLGWQAGDVAQDHLHYEITSEADIEKFFLLPVPSAGKQDIEDAIASIRSTYDRKA